MDIQTHITAAFVCGAMLGWSCGYLHGFIARSRDVPDKPTADMGKR